MTSGGPIEVTAALVLRGREILIARRRDGDLAGFWEFPGGKREAGESLEECLARELREELGLEVEIIAPFLTVEHAYPDRTVLLHAFCCRWKSGVPDPTDHDQVRWVEREGLLHFRLAPADIPIARRLLEGGQEAGCPAPDS